MPKKKKEEGIPGEELVGDQELQEPEAGSTEFTGAEDVQPAGDGLDGDAPPAEPDADDIPPDDAGEAPPPPDDEGLQEDLDAPGDQPASGEDAMGDMSATYECEGDATPYGNLGGAEAEEDPFEEGEGPPQFDLPEGIADGALLLDSPGPFSEADLAAAAAAMSEGSDSGDEADPTPPAAQSPAPRRRKRAAAAPSEAAPPAEDAAAPPARRRRATSTDGVLSIDEDLKVQSVEDKDALLWMELRGSLRSKRILTGTMGGVERTPAGGCIAVIYYKEQRIVIPADEMFIDISVHQTENNRDLQNRYAQILTRTLNAEVDFIISGIDRRAGSVVASRKEAMIRKQINYYHPSSRRRNPLINEGMVVEARIISVGTKNIRVEVFGVETTIWARFVAWEWVEDCAEYYQVGGRVLVKLMAIDRANPERLSIEASIRDCVPNPATKNIEKCQAQGKYIGKVTGMDSRAIYVRLNVGINGVATACHDTKLPGRKDDVAFVITRLDKEQGIAIGIITKIIKQHI